jgi:hypothetical protein
VSTSAKIIQLRELLATRGLATPAKPRQRLLAGWPALDAAAGDGLPKGDLTELHCARHGGALAVAQVLATARHFTALIDGSDSFDLAGVEPSALARLLWVRCHNAAEAVKAADLILRDGNLPLVLMNLRGCADASRVPSQSWYRLQRIVEVSGAALLVLTPRPMIPSARVRIALHHAFTLHDLERDRIELAAALHFQTGRVQGARGFGEDEPQLAEVG